MGIVDGDPMHPGCHSGDEVVTGIRTVEVCAANGGIAAAEVAVLLIARPNATFLRER